MLWSFIKLYQIISQEMSISSEYQNISLENLYVDIGA